MSETLAVPCAGCGDKTPHPVESVSVTDVAGVLHLLWSCSNCGLGHYETAHPAQRALILASGAEAQPVDTFLAPAPDRSALQPRTAPITRIARLLGRRPTQS